ncbi:peptide-methionine (S)-S-oxide reductase MsrA [Pedobacter sandarakinus]|uniref:peptide-methionine (S)-S-oxide reductase MsrA n=1 Tax=Pedobacter sandarakinus TaxID=353156 RepID=UPI0022450826|nr:peptide-methionine (S)-S-oxide reductase MsrA [Pedobacter sandarakinus]MCX2575314.1 peptide-methionine (S)-S-oxide reductase MsrA [Pedobacter sandarakinus]
MKIYKLWLLGFVFLASCTDAQTTRSQKGFATLPEPNAGEQVATFAGGCFWALSEGMSELKGVNKVVSGYAGGTLKNPTYEEVCSDKTGHAESVQVYYDPTVISYAQLSEAFFYAHDPTTLNRQGPDEGEDYRSVAFYRTPEEKKILQQVEAKVNASHHYGDKIVTEIVPIKVFYPAEKYHQDYYKLNPNSGYIQNVSRPKVLKLRKSMSELIKPAFKEKS